MLYRGKIRKQLKETGKMEFHELHHLLKAYESHRYESDYDKTIRQLEKKDN